jgi:hypothetical protein
MRNKILLIIGGGLLYVTLSSKSNGTAAIDGQNRTGAGGSVANCAGSGCHSPNSSTPLSIQVVDMTTGDSTSGFYVPGNVYKVKLELDAGVAYPESGFQFAAAKSNGTGAGSGIPGSYIHSIPVGGFEIIEQSSPIPTPGLTKKFFFYWMAPPPGAGTLTLFATMLASNNDNFASGDVANNQTLIVAEKPLSVSSVPDATDMRVYPNPVNSQLNFTMNGAVKGLYSFTVYSSAGAQVYRHNAEVRSPEFRLAIDATGWAPGMYFMKVGIGGAQRVLPIMRQ